MELSAADYVVLFVGVALSMSVGLFFAIKDRKKMSFQRYHRGDSKLQVLPVAISLLVTKTSSIFFLGVPAEVYAYGIPCFVGTIGKIIGYLTVVFVSIPIFFPLSLTSVFEYLEKRHGTHILRTVAFCLDSISTILYAAVITFGASVALSSSTTADTWVCIVILVGVAVVYTALGGMKAVVFADVIQCFVMLATMFAIVIYGTMSVGGVKKVMDLNKPSGRLDMFDFNLSPLVRNSFWALLIGQISAGFIFMNFQATVQRLNSTRSSNDARKAMFIFLFGLIVLDIIAMSEGLVAFAYYNNKECDPIASGRIKNANQIIPVTVFDMFGHIPGLTGLYLASLSSAALSTLSSLFGGMSAVIVEELSKNILKASSQAKKTQVSKLMVPFIALVCVGTALVVGQLQGPLPQIAFVFMSSLAGPSAVIFIMSIFAKRASVKGIAVGTAASFVVGAWLSIGSSFSPGVKRTPMLPLGPTNGCNILDDAMSTEFKHLNDTFQPSTHVYNTSEHLIKFRDQTPGDKGPTGIDIFYSISFYYFSPVVLLSGIIIGLIASRLLQAKNYHPNVPNNLTMKFSTFCRSCLCYICDKTCRANEEQLETREQQVLTAV